MENESSPIEDYLNGNYPSYSANLFVDDILFSAQACTQGRRIKKLKIAPKLYDSDVLPVIKFKINSNVGIIPIVKDDQVSIQQGCLFETEDVVENDEYEQFLHFLSEFKISCSQEEFKLVKLFDFYRRFTSIR